MQNRKFFATLTAAIALTAGLASCSNNDDELNPKNEGRIPITLTSNVGSRATDQSLQETQIASGVSVGVFITQSTTNIATNNMLTSNGSGSFTGDAGSTNDATTPLNIYAYAPHNSAWENLSDEYTFTVTDQETNDKYYAADLMIAEPATNITPTTDAINLTFKHKMAKLNLNFDLTGAPADFSLEGATVSVLNVKPSVSVNVSTGSIGALSGDPTALKAATLTASDTKASVVFPPQTIAQGTEFVQVVVGSNTYNASLPSEVTFESGKKYTYTVTFTTSGDGGSTTVDGIKLAVSSVFPWEDAQLIACEIGDYVTDDGQIISKNASDLITQNQDKIVAVIFSKDVSATDRAAGYNAYAMGFLVDNTLQWQPLSQSVADGDNTTYTPILEGISTFADALKDLDGRDKTSRILGSSQYSSVSEKEKTIFGYCAATKTFTDSKFASDWFVPSFGQMVQFFNNIGTAGITEQTTSTSSAWSPIYANSESTVIDALNAVATPAGKSFIKAQDESTTEIYVTVTEVENAYWSFQYNPKNTSQTVMGKWGFGRNAGKGTQGRYLLPCVALTLSSSATISATAN